MALFDVGIILILTVAAHAVDPVSGGSAAWRLRPDGTWGRADATPQASWTIPDAFAQPLLDGVWTTVGPGGRVFMSFVSRQSPDDAVVGRLNTETFVTDAPPRDAWIGGYPVRVEGDSLLIARSEGESHLFRVMGDGAFHIDGVLWQRIYPPPDGASLSGRWGFGACEAWYDHPVRLHYRDVEFVFDRKGTFEVIRATGTCSDGEMKAQNVHANARQGTYEVIDGWLVLRPPRNDTFAEESLRILVIDDALVVGGMAMARRPAR